MTTSVAALGEPAAPQSNAARMLLVLAHELRGPLAPIRHAATCLAMQIPEGTPSRKAVGVIERQVTALESLIERVLEAARLEHEMMPLRRTLVNLVDVVADIVDVAAPYVAEHGHTIVVEPPTSPIYIDVDTDQLRQIVGNLITNAAKYTDRGGRIAVRTTSVGKTARICVSDNGIGLAPDMLESIFDLYAQAEHAGAARSAGGLGIGLYVARQLVLAHGGTIVASSQGANCGSEFTVNIPLVGV